MKLFYTAWLTPAAIIAATILYLYADRHEVMVMPIISTQNLHILLVTNKWNGVTCITTIRGKEGADVLTRHFPKFPLCMPDGRPMLF
ncbi:MAG: hypothetical protein ACI8PW_001248 [Methylophilaceae bacterium]|jgi:hypothetical protein